MPRSVRRPAPPVVVREPQAADDDVRHEEGGNDEILGHAGPGELRPPTCNRKRPL